MIWFEFCMTPPTKQSNITELVLINENHSINKTDCIFAVFICFNFRSS